MQFLRACFLFIKKIYQTIYFHIVFIPYTLLICTPITLFFMILRIFPIATWCIHMWAKSSLFLSGQKVTVEGLENIDPKKRYLIISNHGSFTDILAISLAIPYPVSWVLKESLLKIPILNILFKLGIGIPIQRSNARNSQKTIVERIQKLKNGWNPNIIIYPEGTRSIDGTIQPFKRGFIKIMREYELDILPITLSGFHNFIKPGALFTDPESELRIIIKAPQSYQKLKDIDEKELTQQIQVL
ncbi:MAG: lysophospholipid acyltransferase family protein, partial [Brevinema sp.]